MTEQNIIKKTYRPLDYIGKTTDIEPKQGFRCRCDIIEWDKKRKCFIAVNPRTDDEYCVKLVRDSFGTLKFKEI